MGVMNPELNKRTAAALRAASEKVSKLTALVGFDAFVDEIIRVVNKRTSVTEYTRIETISDFAARIAGAAGQSTNMELIVERMKLGGNGPIMANALAALGAAVTCVGPLGEGTLHPAFAPMADHATLISLGDPAHTDALEFEDGKLMMGKLEPMNAITWERMIERVGADKLDALITGSNLVAMVNWTMIPAMEDIWEKSLALISTSKPAGRFFFDLADPEKHNHATIARACRALARFQTYAPSVLGLNEKEAGMVGAALGFKGEVGGRENVGEVAAYISAQLPVETVVVHPRAYAVTASAGKLTGDVDGPFTDEPKISTGAGDHFNAGFNFGKLLAFPDDQCLTAGVGTSGYYVRTAISPSAAQLADFLDEAAGA